MMELYIGGYAEPGKNGVLKCVFDGEHVNVIDSNDELYDPSWVFHHPSKTLLYAVEALPLEGNLAVLSEVDGHLKLLTKVSTKGAAPCHISMPPDARQLHVSAVSEDWWGFQRFTWSCGGG